MTCWNGHFSLNVIEVHPRCWVFQQFFFIAEKDSMDVSLGIGIMCFNLSISLLIGIFRLFTFNVIRNDTGLIKSVILFLFTVYFLSSFLFFSCLLVDYLNIFKILLLLTCSFLTVSLCIDISLIALGIIICIYNLSQSAVLDIYWFEWNVETLSLLKSLYPPQFIIVLNTSSTWKSTSDNVTLFASVIKHNL